MVDHLVVGAFREAVAVLDCRDRDDPASALDLLNADLREPDMPDLPAVAVRGDRAEALLERGLGVDAVQVIEVDRVGAQTPQAPSICAFSASALPVPGAKPPFVATTTLPERDDSASPIVASLSPSV